MKGSNVLLMISHCGIWTGCICVATHLCGLHINGCDVTILFAGHFLADEFQCRGWSLNFNPLGLPLWIDQIIHVGQILMYVRRMKVSERHYRPLASIAKDLPCQFCSPRFSKRGRDGLPSPTSVLVSTC